MVEKHISLFSGKTMEKFYDDALSDAAKELGKAGTDIVKTARLLLAPFQLLGAWQDRLAAAVDRIGKRVPEEFRIETSPEIVGPAFEKMKYISETSELWRMYEEILAKSIDSRESSKVHPAFISIISQICRDEAWIIYHLRDRLIEYTYEFEAIDGKPTVYTENVYEDMPAELHNPNQIDLYVSHLESLNLVFQYNVDNGDVPDHSSLVEPIKFHMRYALYLSSFGRLFATATIPPDGFNLADKDLPAKAKPSKSKAKRPGAKRVRRKKSKSSPE